MEFRQDSQDSQDWEPISSNDLVKQIHPIDPVDPVQNQPCSVLHRLPHLLTNSARVADHRNDHEKGHDTQDHHVGIAHRR